MLQINYNVQNCTLKFIQRKNNGSLQNCHIIVVFIQRAVRNKNRIIGIRVENLIANDEIFLSDTKSLLIGRRIIFVTKRIIAGLIF